MDSKLADAIRTNRLHDFRVSVAGWPLRQGQRVTVRQVRHRFLLGANAFWLTSVLSPEQRAKHEEMYLGLFNSATLPFYWGGYEPVEGEPAQASRKAAAAWCAAHGVTTKGHPLCWHTVCADWLMAYDNPTILDMQMARITREVTAFRGSIDMWDVINEAVIMPVFDKYDNAVTRIANCLGAVELTLRCFQTAREANPEATLLINDFDLSPDYEALIEELLARDCPIDAIGLQTHQHQGYRGSDYMNHVIDRFARFGKPLHFTENTLISGDLMPAKIVDLNDFKAHEWPSTPAGEARQRAEVEEMYSTIYARPEVESLTWWDMVDGHWLGAPSGLVRADLTPKPAYTRLQELIRGEWWFGEQEIVVGEDGTFPITAPEGDYVLVLDGHEAQFPLSKHLPNVTVLAA